MKNLIASIVISVLFISALSAQDTYRIKNEWTGTYLNTDPSLQISQTPLDSKSAHWQIIDVGNNHIKIMNVQDRTYLNIENGALSSSDVGPGWLSAVEGTNAQRIGNVWKKELFINTERGLGCTEIENGWLSAKWALEKVNIIATAPPVATNTNNTESTNQNTSPSNDFFNPEKLLEAHNVLRREVGVPPLTWSNELAAHAKQWAEEKAQNIPGINAQNAHSRTPGMGENYSGGYVDFHPLELAILDGWGKNEKVNFDTTTGKCFPNKVCGHYTQIVWRNTTQVGCGVGTDANGQYVFICNYSPPGNFSGQRAF
ncbi:MAG: CAP domain-containing protein [Patiriisocius sp.]|uniref:CAP domain-containing protein n=1 Tax=Patiriisocius sp. TaxID=2822396 RepID=UPI003EF358F0